MSTPLGHKHERCFDSGYLQVSGIHRIYYEQYGRPGGKPVIYLHGGPGGRSRPSDASFFDPTVYRVILLDQRGAGKSTPSAELRENTSQHLVADIETLREHLGIEKFHLVFGGSWGSTLSLLYAQTHPERVGSLVIRGIYTMRKSEIMFMHGFHGTAYIFPEEHAEFINYLPPEERADPYPAYHKFLTSDDPKTQLRAARAWNKWELAISKLIPDQDSLTPLEDDIWSLQHARMEIHYEINGGFMEEGQLLKPENVDRIKRIPCSIVQGRYDMVCPPKTAWELHKALPESRMFIVPDAGHSAKVGCVARRGDAELTGM